MKTFELCSIVAVFPIKSISLTAEPSSLLALFQIENKDHKEVWTRTFLIMSKLEINIRVYSVTNGDRLF